MNKPEKRALSEEQLQQKRDALKKAVDRKKELGLIRRAEIEQKKSDDDEKILQAKQKIEALDKKKRTIRPESQIELEPKTEPEDEPEQVEDEPEQVIIKDERKRKKHPRKKS